MPAMTDPRKNLEFALEKYPQRTQVAPVEQLVIESARQNAKRPAWIKIAVPDEVVKGLRGGKDDQPISCSWSRSHATCSTAPTAASSSPAKSGARNALLTVTCSRCHREAPGLERRPPLPRRSPSGCSRACAPSAGASGRRTR